jgi:hypothetical protein
MSGTGSASSARSTEGSSRCPVRRCTSGRKRVEAIPDFAEDFDRFPGDWRWVSRSFGAAQTAASVTFVVLPALGVTVAVTTSSALLLAIVNACFCKLWMVFFLSLFAGLFFYVIVGFWNKRKILAKEGVDPVSTSPSVYELEEQLMRALGTQRRGEVQFDVVGTFAVSALYLGMYALGSWLESFVGFRWHFDWQWYFHPLLWAAICGGLGILLAIESRTAGGGGAAKPYASGRR